MTRRFFSKGALAVSGVIGLGVLVASCQDGAGAGPTPPNCVEPSIDCGGVCVTPTSDPAHCGACDQACGASQFCSLGVCSDSCSPGLAVCGQSCVDPLSDLDHCGRCERSCWDGLSCVQGSCILVEGTGGAPSDATSSSGSSNTGSSSDPRIRVSGAEFRKCGQRIFMNGANTPWDHWDDFGGNYDANFWRGHFQDLHQSGLNSSRVWITCSGEVGIDIELDGTVLGPTAAHFEDLDSFFAIAEEQQIHVMATLMSFDHFENDASARWAQWISSDQKIDSYVERYLIPFLERYGDNPYLWAIDLMNEPDWAHEESGISFDRLRAYFARAARAIHQNSDVLVTVGMATPKYNADCAGCEQAISDAELREALDDPAVYLDFYSPHYYDWVGELWGNLFYSSPVLVAFPTSKPLMLGEHPARGTEGHTLTEDIQAALAYGWQGTLPWTSNGVDRNGGFAEVSVAGAAFTNIHPALVFPACD